MKVKRALDKINRSTNNSARKYFVEKLSSNEIADTDIIDKFRILEMFML